MLYSLNDCEKLSQTFASLKNNIFKGLCPGPTAPAWPGSWSGVEPPSTIHLLSQNLRVHTPEDSGAYQFETHWCSVPQTLVLKMFTHFQQMRKRKIQTLNIINAFNLEKCPLSRCYMLPLWTLFTCPVFYEIKVMAILVISLIVSYFILSWYTSLEWCYFLCLKYPPYSTSPIEPQFLHESYSNYQSLGISFLGPP